MRTKVIVISVAGIIISSLMYIIYITLPKEHNDSGNDISLRSDIQSGYSLDDMINSVRKDNSLVKSSLQPSTQVEDEENLKRIQELIQQNEQVVQESKPVPAISHNVTKPEKKRAARDTAKIVENKQPVTTRRTFNSIRLVKESESNAIKAFVHSTQTVMVGSTLKMQLAENCLTDDGQRIRKGTPVYGEVTGIDGERVIVKINSININNNILPFRKNVYSRDAIEGIYVPGNPKSDVAKDAGAAAASGANTNISGGLDIGTQLVAGAANSVINATKSAASKNIRKIKVTIKTNYQLLLMEEEGP